MIQNVNGVSGVYGATAPVSAAKSEEVSEEAAALQTERTDEFVKSDEGTETVGYTNQKKLTADQLRALEDLRTQSYQNMIKQMIGQQADRADTTKTDLYKILNMSETATAVNGDISDDPTWGIDAVATRLIDMAVSLSGGDTSKLETLREAVKKGFSAAGAELGTSLPSVSQNTYTEVMKRFDYWEKNGSMEGYTYDRSAYAAGAAE